MSTNVRVDDLDLPPRGRSDNRRLEVVCDGLPLFQGAQLCVDTTMVSVVRGDGTARRQCAAHSGASLAQARRDKETTYPELRGSNGRARLVVLACEVGGRWSTEARDFVRHLAKAKVRREPAILRHSAFLSWVRRWKMILTCAATRSFARSLLEVRPGLGVDGRPPPPTRCWRRVATLSFEPLSRQDLVPSRDCE